MSFPKTEDERKTETTDEAEHFLFGILF